LVSSTGIFRISLYSSRKRLIASSAAASSPEAMLFSDRENANTADGECLMVDLELDDGLAIVTIDRPHARNAISLETMDQLDKALDGAEGAKALVLTGAGDRAFVSGGDLKELAALRTEWDASTMAFRMRSICDRIAGFPTPTIAALNGHALGGGAEFAVAADIRLAADDIKIGFNQVTLEIMPAWGGAERLVALVGYSKALLLAGTGTVLDAAGAERIGLVDKVIPRANFNEDWRAIAKSLATRPAGEIKRVMKGVSTTEAVAAFARLWVSDEHWAAADKVMKRGK
jgi:enoyl-CoA hydratase/carnithine racemase